jgi:hypothetical protein
VSSQWSGNSQEDDLPTACIVCGAEVERYSPAGVAYCAQHFPDEEVSRAAAMTKEEFLAIAQRIAAAFPGGLHGARGSAWLYPGGACEAERAREPCGRAPGGAGTL